MQRTILLLCSLLLLACQRQSRPPSAIRATQTQAAPIYWIGWSDLPSRQRDNLSFRQRALSLQHVTGGPVLIGRDGRQALRLIDEELAASNEPRPLVYIGHGDGYGLFMAERNGVYRDTVLSRADLAAKYGGGRRQALFSEWLDDTSSTRLCSQALFLSCYSAGVAIEWVKRTGRPAIGALHLVHPVLNADSSMETGWYRCEMPFVRYSLDSIDGSLESDTLGQRFHPLEYLIGSKANPRQDSDLSGSVAQVQEPYADGQLFDR